MNEERLSEKLVSRSIFELFTSQTQKVMVV